MERSCYSFSVSKGEETRLAIVSEAMRTASLIGLEGLSIGALATRLGLSKSGLFAHFKSKENLQVQVLEGAADLFVDSVVRPAILKARGEPRVIALFEYWMRWASRPESPGGCIFVAAATEFDDRPGTVRAHLIASQKAWLKTMRRAADLAVQEGHFREDLDTWQFAFHLHALMLGGHYHGRLMQDPQTQARARAGFELVLRDARPS